MNTDYFCEMRGRKRIYMCEIETERTKFSSFMAESQEKV